MITRWTLNYCLPHVTEEHWRRAEEQASVYGHPLEVLLPPGSDPRFSVEEGWIEIDGRGRAHGMILQVPPRPGEPRRALVPLYAVQKLLFQIERGRGKTSFGWEV